MTLGEQILKYRKQKGMSQEELAERLNVSRQSVSLWETNQTVPQIDYLMELSQIFNVTLDELCNNDTKSICNEITETTEGEQTDDILAMTHFEYDEDKIKKLIKILDKRQHTIIAIFLNCLVVGLFSAFSDDFGSVLAVFIIINIFLFVLFRNLNKKSIKILQTEKRVIDIKFFNDYFISNVKTINTETETKLNYSDIARLHIDDEFVVIIFNNKYVVFEQKVLIENRELILSSLKSQSKKFINRTTNMKDNAKLKTVSILLFVLSFVSLILALISVGLISGLGRYSFANKTFVLNMWVFFVFAAIPLGSFIFGIIFNNRFKCKKNIIAGIIMTAILVLYGSFCIIWRPFFSFDEKYLKQVSIETNLNFPSEFLIVTDKITGLNETYVKFTDNNDVIEFENYIMSSNIWDQTSNLPTDVDLSVLLTIKSYDYFYIHIIDEHSTSNFHDKNIDQILLAYSTENDVLVIYEIQLEKEN